MIGLDRLGLGDSRVGGRGYNKEAAAVHQGSAVARDTQETARDVNADTTV